MTVLRKFLRNARGNVSILVAATLPVLVAVAGGVLDYTVAISGKAKLQSMVDSATLYATKLLKEDPDISEDEITTKAEQYLQSLYNANGASGFVLASVNVEKASDGNAVTVSATGRYTTSFLKLISIDHMDFPVRSAATFNYPPLEVALVLDNTGSMNFDEDGNWCYSYSDSCNRMGKLKEAARNFITQLEANSDGDPDSVKVGIVPYSHYVRIDNSFQDAPWLNTEYAQSWVCTSWWWRWCLNWEYQTDWDGFVGFRPNYLYETDGSYSSEGVPAVNDDSPIWLPNLARVMPLTPLTDEGKQALLDRIDEMYPEGGTFIPGGLEWGARILSPFDPFSEGATYEDTKERKLRKVIVLMTDGINTCSQDGSDQGYVRCNSGNNVDMDGLNSMERICNKLKETNPDTGMRYAEIITVGFDLSFLDPVSRDLVEEKLKGCATLGYYPAESSNIAEVFGRIGAKLAKLHLTE